MKTLIDRLKNGIIKENPIFVQVLAMCPTLAVTSSVENAIGMGLATTAVLICSNAAVSLIRKFIPSEIRIPSFIVIIATFVTMVDFLMQGYSSALYKQLGIFIPLIVVNCIILGRAEAYASKNNVLSAIFDGLGMGLGFLVSLVIIGSVREIIGAGTFYGMQIMPQAYQPVKIMVLAPGAFFTMGILMALINVYNIKRNKKTVCIHDCSKCHGCAK